jgi:hypothetical protein
MQLPQLAIAKVDSQSAHPSFIADRETDVANRQIEDLGRRRRGQQQTDGHRDSRYRKDSH